MGRSLTSRIWRVPPLNLSPDTFFFGVMLRSFSRKFALGSNLRFSGFYFVKNGFFDFQKVLSCLSVGSPFAARPPNLKKSNVFSRVSKIERDEIRIRGKQFFWLARVATRRPGRSPRARGSNPLARNCLQEWGRGSTKLEHDDKHSGGQIRR